MLLSQEIQRPKRESFAADDFASPPLELARWQRFPLAYLDFIKRLEQERGLLAAAFVVAITAELISIFFASTMTGYYSARFIGLSADPFARGTVPIPYPEHRLRLLGPLFAWMLGLKGGWGTMIPPAFNVPMLAVIYQVLRRRVSIELTVVTTLFLATTQLTTTSRTLLGYHDSMVFFFLFLAMVVRSLPGCLACFSLALLGDPRVALCIPLMAVWNALETGRGWKSASIRAGSLVLLTLGFVAASKVALVYLEYEGQASERLSTYFDGRYLKNINLHFLPISLWMTFRAGWLLAFVPFWVWLGKRPWLVLGLSVNLLAIVLAGVAVHDVSRALVFAFPLVLLGVILAHRAAPRFAVAMASTCYLVNLLTPTYQGWTWTLWIQSAPLPWVVARSWWNP